MQGAILANLRSCHVKGAKLIDRAAHYLVTRRFIHRQGLLQPVSGEGYVIGGDAPITRMIYTRMWNRIKKKVNLFGATAHVFRHSYLTLASNAGITPKTIQGIAGHADIMTTMNRYVHAQQDQILDAGRKIAPLFQPEPPATPPIL